MGRHRSQRYADVIVLNPSGGRDMAKKHRSSCGARHNPPVVIPGCKKDGFVLRLLKHGGAVIVGAGAGVGGTWALSKTQLTVLQKAGILGLGGATLGVVFELLGLPRLGVASMAAPVGIAGLYTVGQLSAQATANAAATPVAAPATLPAPAATTPAATPATTPAGRAYYGYRR
jgi:hypothetical protein